MNGLLKKYKRRVRHLVSMLRGRVRYALRRPAYTGKVFCIGYQKTGTTTLGRSLRELGYCHASFNREVWRKYYRRGRVERVIDYAARFESFDDLPWMKEDLIPVLDARFPGSRFIYLERDEASWCRSFEEWSYKKFGRQPDMELELEAFRRHRDFVMRYFASRSDDIIVLDVREPEGFERLARFLGKSAPSAGFPHHNKTADIRSIKR